MDVETDRFIHHFLGSNQNIDGAPLEAGPQPIQLAGCNEKRAHLQIRIEQPLDEQDPLTQERAGRLGPPNPITDANVGGQPLIGGIVYLDHTRPGQSPTSNRTSSSGLR